MKKFILLICMLFIITGCQNENTAKDVVEDYLVSYQDLEYQVLVDMEEVISKESDFTDDQKNVYRDILKKQYSDLTFNVLNEKYNKNEASVVVEISVYDYYKAEKNAILYQEENLQKFYDDENNYSLETYLNYKLSAFQSTLERVDHKLEFNLIKEDGIWKLKNVSNEVLEKIHGIYDYEE